MHVSRNLVREDFTAPANFAVSVVLLFHLVVDESQVPIPVSILPLFHPSQAQGQVFMEDIFQLRGLHQVAFNDKDDFCGAGWTFCGSVAPGKVVVNSERNWAANSQTGQTPQQRAAWQYVAIYGADRRSKRGEDESAVKDTDTVGLVYSVEDVHLGTPRGQRHRQDMSRGEAVAF